MLEKGLSNKSKNTEARKKYVNYEPFVLPRQRLCQKKVLQTSKPFTEARKASKLRAFWASKAEPVPEKRPFREVSLLQRPEKHVNYEPVDASKAEPVPETGSSNKYF